MVDNIKQPSTATSPQPTTIVGIFNDRVQADKAVDDLYRAGFHDDQIGFAMRHDEELIYDTTNEGNTHAGASAVTGALAGLGLGALAGLGVLAGVIPVIGPAIAAGTLGSSFRTRPPGLASSVLRGALVGAGVPEHEAKYYQDEFEAGRVIVTVAAGNRVGEAAVILLRSGAYYMTTREVMTHV